MTDLRVELLRKYGRTSLTPVREESSSTVLSTPVENETAERAFVVEGESGRTVISAPLREVAAANKGFTYLKGRFVEADTPNRNGALWTTDDLQMGEASVVGGPLNWLHDDTHIIGTLMDAKLVAGKEAASAGIGNHIQTSAAVWRFLFPNETAIIEKAAADNKLWYSMECVSEKVMCVDSPDHPGCGETFEYAAYNAKEVCGHLKERSSVRRFVNPIFLGGAIIVPPVQPGWAKADVEVVRQAAAISEEHGLAEAAMARPEAEQMVQQILMWANR